MRLVPAAGTNDSTNSSRRGSSGRFWSSSWPPAPERRDRHQRQRGEQRTQCERRPEAAGDRALEVERDRRADGRQQRERDETGGAGWTCDSNAAIRASNAIGAWKTKIARQSNACVRALHAPTGNQYRQRAGCRAADRAATEQQQTQSAQVRHIEPPDHRHQRERSDGHDGFV